MTWKNPEKWEAMKRGDECPMCSDIFLEENKHSFLIAELEYSYVRFPKNQYYKGWVVVFFKRHANELYELSAEELAGYTNEVARVAKAVNDIYKPVKINYAVFGSLCPHVHYHIIPRFFTDDPHAPIKTDEKELLLTDKEYKEAISKLRKTLK
jgi:ATP adenylyltransferase